jgi:DDE superfamily endonuclease/Helix-turn-helix of DDE superfamily endonuclease
MIARLDTLRRHPAVFRSLTGLSVAVFDALTADVVPLLAAADVARLDHPDRERAVGGGRKCGLTPFDQVLLAVVWLRTYPTDAVLAFLFGVSESAARRTRTRVVPVLAQAGKDGMRMPDPGRGKRKDLAALAADTPGLGVLVDSFEQPTARPTRGQKRYDSGKKKRHTLKSQLVVAEGTGKVADVSDSVPGPTADVKLLKRSKVLRKVKPGVAVVGDSAYVGAGKLKAGVVVVTPRRKPRGQPRSRADRRYNRGVSRRRIRVEHTIRRVRIFQAVTQVNRHGRVKHEDRVRAVAGLVNRLIDARPKG